MNKNSNNNLVKVADAIILINDNYKQLGLLQGYVGTVVDNYIENLGFVLADFSNPFTGETICGLAEINKNDFKIVSSSKEDQKILKDFKNLFK